MKPGVLRKAKEEMDQRQFISRRLRGRIAAQPIGDDLARHRARAQHAFEDTFGGGLVAPLLQQDVKFGAVLVDRTPQQARWSCRDQASPTEVDMMRTTHATNA
jgi:hypothetical protein